jgi:hypothetical protein
MARTRSHMATRSNKIKKYYHSLNSSAGRTRKITRRGLAPINKSNKCKKSYIIYKSVKSDCTPVLRQVMGEGRGKYIQHNGYKKMLSSIKGKYRFTDKKL